MSVFCWTLASKQFSVVFSSQYKQLSLRRADVLLEKVRACLLFFMVGLCSLSIPCIQNIFLCHVSFQYVYSNNLESYADYDCTNSTNIVSHFMSI